MKGNVWSTVAGWLALGVVAMGTGCTGTDFLSPGNFEVALETTTAAGPEGFQCVTLGFNAIELRPLDAGAAAALGNEDLSLLIQSRSNVDFAPDAGCPFGARLPASRVLSSGSYLITQLTVNNPLLSAETTFLQCGGTQDISGSYGAPLIVTVGPGQANRMRFVLDVAALEAAIQAGGCDEFFGSISDILEIQ